MFKNIDHIAIKVSDLEKLRASLGEIGMPCLGTDEFPEVGMRIAFLGGADTALELLEVQTPSSPIAKDAEGFHHVGLRVSDIEVAYGQMNRSDTFEVEGPIRKGAHSRIFFFRITGESHTLFECVEQER